MALFNRLAQTTGKTAEGARGDTRQRRANARFQTQPITQGEVDQVKKVLPHVGFMSCDKKMLKEIKKMLKIKEGLSYSNIFLIHF